jgi:hypothetical protein
MVVNAKFGATHFFAKFGATHFLSGDRLASRPESRAYERATDGGWHQLRMRAGNRWWVAPIAHGDSARKSSRSETRQMVGGTFCGVLWAGGGGGVAEVARLPMTDA